MPKAFPTEFRRDVEAVVRKGEAPLAQIAKDFRDLGVLPAPLAEARRGRRRIAEILWFAWSVWLRKPSRQSLRSRFRCLKLWTAVSQR